MLRLLRNIRHKLLGESSYGTYLLYASGEILLVIIGILLALQIDNWSDKRKTERELTSIFEDIREDLVLDTTKLSDLYKQRILDLEAQNRVIDAIRQDKPFDDQIRSDLGRVMLRRDIHFVTTGFSLLKENKLTSVEDRTIRTALISYYEQDVANILGETDDDGFEFETVLLPYIRNNFETWGFGNGGVPFDWNELKKDPYFLNALLLNLGNVRSTADVLAKGLQSATTLLQML